MTGSRRHDDRRLRRSTPTSTAGSATSAAGSCPRRWWPRSTSSPSPGRRRWPTRRSSPSSTPSCASTPASRACSTTPPGSAEKVGGARILLKREDLNHTGAHKIRNVLGQALLTRRMGKTRVIAETGAGQHGVASATAAAYFGLDCTVYMGSVDTKRQALNVARMQLLGAKVVPVDSGSATLKDAINEALRDWVATRRPHGVPLRHRRRPAPVPEHGPRLHPRHRRRGPRPVPRAAPAGCPTPIAACVGGGSNAIGLFTAFLDDPDVAHLRLRGRRRRASRPAGTPRRSTPASAACCTAPAPSCSRTRTARPSSRTRSRPGSTTPASARSTPTSPRPAAPTTCRSPTPRRWTRWRCWPAPRGSSRRSSPRTRSPAPTTSPASSAPTGWSWSTSPAAATRTWGPPWSGSGSARRRGASERVTHVGTAFEKARAEGRAALVGYLPAGFPDVDGRHRRARGDGRRRLRRHRGRAALQRPGHGRPDHPGRRPAGAGRRRPHHRRAAHRRGGRRHRHPDRRDDLLEPRRALRRRRGSPPTSPPPGERA